MTALGYGGDKRLGCTFSLLKKKRRRDGKWLLEAVHPDVEGGMTEYYDKLNPIPVSFEKSGEPSKMITLKAMTVLHRVESPR
jgi:hypothetical protein